MTTTIGTDCGCSGTAVSTPAGSFAPTSGGERTRYYPRQLVSAADLTQDQLYFREKSRRHNRMLHGWGIVCGARVRVTKQPSGAVVPGCVDIEPAYILGPFGDEIMIDGLTTVDLTVQNIDGDAANGCVPPDPWCADVKASRPADRPVYLAIAYAEFACRPVQASATGCGCDDGACEYSRLRDSYRIRVLDELPSTYPAVMQQPSVARAVSCRSANTFSVAGDAVNAAALVDEPAAIGRNAAANPLTCDCPRCSPCPSDPWVILADITMNGSTVTAIDCDAHRRYCTSFRDYFYLCGDHT